MRPGQNKRPRGRNNNNGGGNRKGPNPLTRSYESNGPDVKVRGTAQHIAEKYLQLARDAQTSSDPVMAESYLQHAEHYYRLIAAAQAAQQAQMGFRPPVEVEFEEDDEDPVSDRFASVAERLPPQQFPAGHPQAIQPQVVSVNAAMQPPEGYQDRQSYQSERVSTERPPQQQERPHNNRQPRQDRSYNNERNERQGFNNRDNKRFREPRPDYTTEVRPLVDARPQDVKPQEFRSQEFRSQEFRPPESRHQENRAPEMRQPAMRQQENRPQERSVDPRAPEDFRLAPGEADVASALPAFITAPPRVGIDPAPTPSAAPELPLDQGEAPAFHQRSRRRRRTRAEIDSDEGEERARQAAAFAPPVPQESD